MGPVVPSPRLIRFGVFELDLRSGELQRQGRKIRLEGQPVQILICLLENPGELVTREELHRKLWPADTFVDFEQGLNAAVKRLRHALNDSADNPLFVETLPRRGYRFIAPVETVGPSQNVPDAGGAPPEQSPVGVEDHAARERLPWLSRTSLSGTWLSRKGAAFASILALVLIAIWSLRPVSPVR